MRRWISLEEKTDAFSSSGSSDMQGCDHEEADTRIAYMFCTLSINKGHNHTGCYSNSGHRHRCTWIMIGLFNKLLPLHLSANVRISLAMEERFQLISACQCHLCISLSWYTSRNASVSFLYWLWHHLLLRQLRQRKEIRLGSLEVVSWGYRCVPLSR